MPPAKIAALSMIRELHMMDDRGTERPVRADDLLAGEPWKASRSGVQPSEVAPAVFRTWWQALIVGLSNGIGSLFLAGVLGRFLNIHYFLALILVVCTWGVLYATHRRYGGKLHSMFWRRRLAHRTTLKAARQHARLSIARHRMCPCCAYSLAEVPADPDGCTPCPECGAAWRVDLWSSDAGIYHPPAVTVNGQGHDQSRVTASDGRGVIVPLLARRKDIDRHEAIRVCPSRPSRVRLRLSLLAWAIYLAMTGTMAWFIVVLVQPEYLMVWIGTGMMIAFGAILLAVPVGIAYTHQFAIASHPYLIRVMVAAHACPCCESPLRSSPSVIDGCLLCDTCGSAWNPPASG